MTPPDSAGSKKFPDFVPPTKVHYDGVKPTTVHLRKCKLVTQVGGRTREHLFDKATVTVGAIEDNDLVVTDETVSRYHCRIVQEDTGYGPSELESTFRYPGPKPQDRENGIVMLADAVESSSRTLNDPTPGSIRKLVHDMLLRCQVAETRAQLENEISGALSWALYRVASATSRKENDAGCRMRDAGIGSAGPVLIAASCPSRSSKLVCGFTLR